MRHFDEEAVSIALLNAVKQQLVQNFPCTACVEINCPSEVKEVLLPSTYITFQ